MDQMRLACGAIQEARGPPDRRYYLVGWLDGSAEWVEHRHFTESTHHLIAEYFFFRPQLDCNDDLEVAGEHRCIQCNAFLPDQTSLRTHILQRHTYPVCRGTVAYRKAFCKVQQRFQQEQLPRVRLLGGYLMRNSHMARWLGMWLDPTGDDEQHVRTCVLKAEIVFGQYRGVLRDRRLSRAYKVSTFKSAAISRATFGCEAVDLTRRNQRRFKTFNAKCSSVLSGRSVQQELREPSFDLLAWIRWRRLVFVGKVLRGEKGIAMLKLMEWNFDNRTAGDVFYSVPPGLVSTFQGLVAAASDKSKWQEMCDELKPPKWTCFDHSGNTPVARRSQRQANRRRGDERSLRHEELRRQLRGRSTQLYPPPSEVPHGEVHVYTDGASTVKRGRRKAGAGVWFADNSDLNISTSPTGRQTSNRAELTAIILAMRRAPRWPTFYSRVTVYSDSLYCVDGVNKWMARWREDGWSRAGQPLRNQDLWELLRRVFAEYQALGYVVEVRRVPAHVGIVGNERTDKLAEATARRAHRNCVLSADERTERRLESLADALVASLLATK